MCLRLFSGNLLEEVQECFAPSSPAFAPLARIAERWNAAVELLRVLPEMSAEEVTDHLVSAIKGGKYDAIICNYANPDMVGHTGILPAVEIAVETVDLCLGRVLSAVREANGILIVSADHGNSDDMFERHKKTGDVIIDDASGQPKTKTAHSLNPVPVHIYDPAKSAPMRLSKHSDLGISSLAATTLTLLGFEPPEDYTPSIVDIG